MIPAYRMYQIKSCFVNEISITSLHFQVQKVNCETFSACVLSNEQIRAKVSKKALNYLIWENSFSALYLLIYSVMKTAKTQERTSFIYILEP